MLREAFVADVVGERAVIVRDVGVFFFSFVDLSFSGWIFFLLFLSLFLHLRLKDIYQEIRYFAT